MRVFYVVTSLLNTGLSVGDSWLYLLSPAFSQTSMCLETTETLSEKDTNEHRHSTSANPLVHIRHTIFLSCFSSAFPNGWLNQLCGAWFKSLGMLGYCQLLDGWRAGSKVTEGAQFPSLCLRENLLPSGWVLYQMSASSTTVSRKLFFFTKKYYYAGHPGSQINRLKMWKDAQKQESANNIICAVTTSHTVRLSAHKPNGRLSKTLQSALQPHYREEMLQNDMVWILPVFSLSCPLLRTPC